MSTAGRLALAAVAATALLGLAPPASGSPPPPVDLRVEGGEENWYPSRSFRLLWRNPLSGDGTPIAAVHYRVRDPSGEIAVPATRIGWAATSLEDLEVPGPPGAYTAEVWLEDARGERGAPAATKLRFDDVPPGPVEPLPAASWIGRTAFPLSIRLGHPSGAPPVSGIHGYAVSVAPPPGTWPCTALDRCTDADTDLRGGAGDDSYLLADLPEGTSYLQAVAVSGAGVPSATVGGTLLRVDKTSPIARLLGAPAGWANRAVALTVLAEDGGAGMQPDGANPAPFTAIAIDGGTPVTAVGAAVGATVIAEGVHWVAYYARDLAGNVNDGGLSNGVRNPQPTSATVRIDRSPPRVSFARAQDPSDPELIRASVEDSLSGPDAARGSIAVRRAGSGDRFAPLPATFSSGGEMRARWDSDSYAPGDYEFQAVGYDRAGNAASTTRRAGGAAMVLSNPLKQPTVLRAGFGKAPGGRRHDLRWQEVLVGGRRRGVVFGGRLTTATGAPLAAMPVRVVECFAAGAGTSLRTSIATTDTTGAFAIRLPPGPSREITASFDGGPTLSRSASSVARLGVRSEVRLRASSGVARIGGAPLVFRGQVVAEPDTVPVGGKSVELQFRLPGLPWSEFRTVQTDRRGRFRYAYRFSDDDSRGVRFRFRAYAPAQDDWPYEPGGSRPVVVRGL